MANLTLGNKSVVTQSGSAEPILTSNVNLNSATFPAGHVKNIYISSGRYNASSGQQTLTNDTETRVSNVLSIAVTSGYKYFFIFNVPTVAIGGNVNSQSNKSIRFYIRKITSNSVADGSSLASQTLIHATGQTTLYINTNWNGPTWTGAVCGIYTATSTETNYFCGSAMTGESGGENGVIVPTDINAMLICQEIYQ